MGAANAVLNFDPSGRSDSEIMQFCNAFTQQLHRYIGSDIDIPAGDIDVGAREIGFLFGAHRHITSQFQDMLTGKSLSFGVSQMRTQPPGYGVMYFLEHMLKKNSADLEGKSIIISGAGKSPPVPLKKRSQWAPR